MWLCQEMASLLGQQYVVGKLVALLALEHTCIRMFEQEISENFCVNPMFCLPRSLDSGCGFGPTPVIWYLVTRVK
jgi:hypothetical protein